MSTPAPFLNADELCGTTFVRHAEFHETITSTNDRATELAANQRIELPALVVARHQTSGRGRGQNAWWSADGALTFSLLLDPITYGITTLDWPRLSLATAVAICDALSRELERANQWRGAHLPAAIGRVGIKWPNDIMLDGAKVCGILLESPGGGAPTKNRLIIGIGINVNNSWQAAPREAGANGTALCDATAVQHNLQDVLTLALNAVRDRILQVAINDPRLPAAWQELCWLTEQRVEAHSNGKWIDGICQGIAIDGALVIENVFGTHRITSGSVRAAGFAN